MAQGLGGLELQSHALPSHQSCCNSITQPGKGEQSPPVSLRRCLCTTVKELCSLGGSLQAAMAGTSLRGRLQVLDERFLTPRTEMRLAESEGESTSGQGVCDSVGRGSVLRGFLGPEAGWLEIVRDRYNASRSALSFPRATRCPWGLRALRATRSRPQTLCDGLSHSTWVRCKAAWGSLGRPLPPLTQGPSTLPWAGRPWSNAPGSLEEPDC